VALNFGVCLIYEMRTRILSIISIGITIGFLLGMGVVALLRSLLDGETPQLEAAFTMMVVMMGGGLVYYVYKAVR
jgi:NhaP-type Na+/H+ or K+/H+ antiporter